MLNLQVSGKLILLVFVAIFLAHGWATLSAAYFYYWWLDMVMHIAGGFWVGIIAMYLIKSISLPPFIAFWLVFGSAAIVGIFWEFFEFALGFMQQGLEDALSDLMLDLIGGILAISLFQKRQKNYNEGQ